MAIPSDILAAIKDILRIPATVTTYNSRIQQYYERVLTALTRETDYFATITLINSVAGQSLYTVSDATTRILSVRWNNIELWPVQTRSLDTLSTWQTDEEGTPEVWVFDTLPGSLDDVVVTPRHFAVHPAPQTSGTGIAGLAVTAITQPANDAPTTQWVIPYLIYETAAEFSLEHTDEGRDTMAGQWWKAVAKLFREAMAQRN